MPITAQKIPVTVPEGGECEPCVQRLREAVLAMGGVQSAEYDQRNSNLVVSYDPDKQSLDAIRQRAQEAGGELAQRYSHETFTLTDLDCADCARKVERAVSRIPGVTQVSANFAASKMYVEYETARTNPEDIVRMVESLGYGAIREAVVKNVQQSTLQLSGMDCADCAIKLEKVVSAIHGVAKAEVNFTAAKMRVEHDPSLATVDQIISAIGGAGYGASLETAAASAAARPLSFWRRSRRLALTVASAVLLGIGWGLSILGVPDLIAVGFLALAIIVGGLYIFRGAIYSAKVLSLDMNVLMTIAVIGGAVLGQWEEAATIVLLFSIGNVLESYTMDRTRASIRSLMDLAPNQALVRRDGHEVTVPVEMVELGEIVIVRPGERVSMDGVVAKGASSVNQAPITGESIPVEKSPGDNVFAGTINEGGALEVKVTKPFKDNTISRIIQMVEEAQAKRAPSQQFVDRFSRYYTPAVIIIAALIALIPPLLFAQPASPWIYRALVLLVIACPCALVISTPVAIVSAIGLAARSGVLIKGGSYLEEAGSLSVIAFDKTGTLTEGRPEVVDIVPVNGKSEDEVLGLAGSIEAYSEHPLAQAILRRARHGESPQAQAEAFQAITGRGARAVVNGETYYAGSIQLFSDLGTPLDGISEKVAQFQGEGKTTILVGSEKQVEGIVSIRDQIRKEARDAVRELRATGIKHIVMLTGDNDRAASVIAKEVGVDEYMAELLPQDKVTAIKTLLRKYGKVAMVGDGVNDAPALATATVGIAMGAAGTDVALETADVALMSSDLMRLSFLMRLGRATLSRVQQNISVALAIKAIFVALTVPGFTSLWLAVGADTGNSLLVTGNALRLLRFRDRRGS